MTNYRHYERPADTDPVSCSCGWTGEFKDLSTEFFESLTQHDCPKCLGRICLVSFPTVGETRAAAKGGHAEAQTELPRVSILEPRSRYPQLTDPAQLPDVAPGTSAVIRIDQVGPIEGRDPLHAPWLQVAVNGVVVWVQPALWEGINEFEQMIDAVRWKYSDAIEDLEVSDLVRRHVLGDTLSNSSRFKAAVDPPVG